MIPRTILISALCSVALGASSCVRPAVATGGNVDVVASFYPLAEAAQQVGGGNVDVTNLTAPGVEPHDLELTPNQLEAIATSDVVLYLGGGFQPAVQDAVASAQGVAVDVSSGLRSLPVPAGESEASLTADPHVWLDPVLYERIVGEVAAALARVDRSDAAAFERNAAAFTRRIRALDGDFHHGLAHCARTVIVTSHAAFGYLSREYGLTQDPISGLSPESEPDPRRLAELQQLVGRDGVTTIFTEDLVSPKVAETLARETGATTAVLNPLESLTAQELASGENYISVMHANLETLRIALGCS